MQSPEHLPSKVEQPRPHGNPQTSRQRVALLAVAIVLAIAGAVVIYAIILRHQTIEPTTPAESSSLQQN